MNIIFFGDVWDDTLRCIFSGHLCFFSQEGNVTPPTPTHIYRKYHISLRFLIKIIFFHFQPKEKIIFSGKKKYHLSRYYKKDHVQARIFRKDHLIQNVWKICHISRYFLRKIMFHFVSRIRSYFQEKEISFFLIIQEKSYSSAIFLEWPSFQNIWKKKIWFYVQCFSLTRWILSRSFLKHLSIKFYSALNFFQSKQTRKRL